MPFLTKFKATITGTAILAGATFAEAVNLYAGRPSIFQNLGKGSMDLPPWLEDEEDRLRAQKAKEKKPGEKSQNEK